MMETNFITLRELINAAELILAKFIIAEYIIVHLPLK